MSDPASDIESEPDPALGSGSGADDWVRRTRLAAVFGDVLPETTSDEREPGGGGAGEREDSSDAWLRAQVPPHHG